VIPSEQEALLRAVAADPADDLPRLVYADWLDEHGDDEQAVYVRAAVAGTTTADGNRDWLRPLDLPAGSVTKWERGFPWAVYYLDPSRFFAEADRLFALLPVRSLTLHASQEDHLDGEAMARLAALPHLAKLTRLDLWDQQHAPTDAWERLFNSPHLTGLDFLGLTNCALEQPEAELLAAAPTLAGLTALDLGYNFIEVGGGWAILNSPHLKNLTRLWLPHTYFGEEDGEDQMIEALDARFGDGLDWENTSEE
jgi:uncharacterized protein (TIGR02996 family)